MSEKLGTGGINASTYRTDDYDDTEEPSDYDYDDPNFNSEEEEDDFDCYYTQQYNDDEEKETVDQHKLLTHDLDMLKKIYGEQAFNIRLLASIDNLDVELKISMDFLYEEQAKAWNVNRLEPLIVRLHLCMSKYLDTLTLGPKVEVFQPSRKEKFAIGSQLKKIIESFITEHWKGLTNDYVASQHAFPMPGHESDTRGNATKKSPQSECPLSEVDDATLARLVGMGFDIVQSREALLQTRGSDQEALDILCGRNDKDDTKPVGEQDLPKESVPKTDSSSRLKKLFSKNSTSSKASRVPLKPDKVRRSTSHASEKESESSSVDVPSKAVPGLEYGWLVQVMRYAQQRVPTLNEFCVVCDEPHAFQNGSMLKPAVCSRELCVFAYQTLGVMYAADEIALNAEVVDLMVIMAKSACISTRRENIFDPYPTVVDPKIPTELAFNPKMKDFSCVSYCFQCIPDMEIMSKMSAVELRQSMDASNPKAYPLLQWVITSNRSHIVKLDISKQLDIMQTPHQFLLLSSPPAKEARFRVARAKYGSTFAFHGSKIENWHSIIRQGLINASGTKLQINGAAYGKGIYLSPQAHISFFYSGKESQRRTLHRPVKGKATKIIPKDKDTKTGQRFLNHSSNLSCIALCEVVTSGELRKAGSIWVCPNPDHVCTRFFFVYENSLGQVPDVHTQQEDFKQMIQAATQFQLS